MEPAIIKELPSGAKLEITVSPFREAKALFQALASEAKGLKLDPKDEVDVNLFKDLFCAAVESPRIEAALWECLKRCTYDGKRITAGETFEPVKARGDYLVVCMEVARENVAPFMNDLYAKFAGEFKKLTKSPA